MIMTNLSTRQPFERVIVSPSNNKNLEVKIKLISIYFLTGLRNLLQPCSRAARKWRENEEMDRKWRENEEIERKLRGNEEMDRE